MARQAKNRITNMRLDEVSLVDAGCNPGAHVLLLKRLGASANSPAGAAPAGQSGNNRSEENEMNDAETKALQAQLAKALSLSSMSDADKAFMKSLPEAKRDEFVALAEDKRADFIKANTPDPSANETIVVDGVTFRKSEVGAGVFALLKSTNARIAALTTLVETTVSSMSDATFAKKAEEQYPYLPGTPAEKGALLKSIHAMPKAEQDRMLAVFKTANDAVQLTTVTLGDHGLDTQGNPDAGTAAGEVEGLVQKSMKDHNTTYDVAYTAVITARPDLYERMEADRVAKVKAA